MCAIGKLTEIKKVYIHIVSSIHTDEGIYSIMWMMWMMLILEMLWMLPNIDKEA